MFSCNDDEKDNIINIEINLNNTSWKVDHYEYRSKNYSVSGCDINDKINIHNDMSGTYQNSEKDSNNKCYLSNDISVTWIFDKLSNNLILNYQQNNTPKTKTFVLESISDNDIRVITNKNIENFGTVEVIEVWIKSKRIICIDLLVVSHILCKLKGYSENLESL